MTEMDNQVVVCDGARYERVANEPLARASILNQLQLMEAVDAAGRRVLVKQFTLTDGTDPVGVADRVKAALAEVSSNFDRLSAEDRRAVVATRGVGLYLGRLLVVRDIRSAGTDLHDLQAAFGGRGPTVVKEAPFWQAMERLAAVLDALRKVGVAHGHVRPSNVFVEARDGGHVDVGLLDVGVARAVSLFDSGVRARMRADPSFVPPDGPAPPQASPAAGPGGGHRAANADVYGLACTYCHLRLGKLLSAGESAAREPQPLTPDEFKALQHALTSADAPPDDGCARLVQRLRGAVTRPGRAGPSEDTGSRADRALLVEQIAKLRKYAERVADALPRPGEPVPAGYEGRIQEVRDKAAEVVRLASSPVRIGIVGGFSAGKSLLLGTLVADAKILPVEDRPTTGNVATVHLLPDASADRTEVISQQVEWLDRQTALAGAEEMLRRAKELSPNLPDVDQPGLGGLLEAAGRRAENWTAVVGWCEHAWSRCGSPPNKSFRALLRELVWFARCCASPAGQALLGRADEDRLMPLPNEGVVQAALLLPPGEDLSQMPFSDLPAGPGMAPVPDPLTAEFVRLAFPLIRRVDVGLRLPRSWWDLVGDDGPPFLLLDLPGLGAAQSGARDAFLCQQEMQQIQTILVVLNAAQPGGDTGPTLFNTLQKTRPGQDLANNVLVALNRFDGLPGGAPAAADGVREAALMDDVPMLHQVKVDAAALTPYPDRVVLTSALFALDQLPQSLNGMTPALYQSARRDLRNWYAEDRDRWSAVGEALGRVDPRSVLADQLRSVAFDGGLGRLKARVAGHVSEHGLKQLLDSIFAQAKELRRQYELLPRRKAAGPVAGPPTYEALREEVENLRLEYKKLKASFKTSPVELALGETSLYQVIETMVRDRFWDLNQWGDLWRQAAGSAGAAQAAEDFPDWAESTIRPADTTAFYDEFAAVLADCSSSMRGHLKAAISAKLKALDDRLGPIDPRLKTLLQDPHAQQRVRALRGAGDLLTKLQEADNPARPSVHDKLVGVVDRRVQPCKPELAYPMPGKNTLLGAGSDAPFQLPWGENPRSDQALIVTLRTQLVIGLRFPLLEQAQRVNQVFGTGLNLFIDRCLATIDAVLNQHEFLTALAGGAGAAAGGGPWGAGNVQWPFPQ